MKTLHLNVKKKFFEMILLGEKKEEYREIKAYWITRFVDWSDYPKESKDDCKNIAENILYDIQFNGFCFPDDLRGYFARLKDFDVIVFRNGYAKNAPSLTVEFKEIEIGEAKPEWSDNWKGNVFKLKLGEIINQ